jgi:hypothetical protein
MIRTSCILLAVAATTSALAAQANSLPIGYDGALANISSATYYGRRGAAYPNGEIGLAFLNQLCNPGTIPVEWRAPMQADHPMFGFLVAKEVDGRLVQISDWSYCKHAFLSLNSGSVSPCLGGCVQPPAGGAQLGVKCSDVYTAGNNSSRTYLGPPAEIDPWLGVWNPVGSYFDIGDPRQANFPAAADGVRSLDQAVFTGNPVDNRVTLREQDIGTNLVNNLLFQIHVVHRGERVENRGNNIMSRPFVLTRTTGTTPTWTTSTPTATPATFGSVLTRWTGATITEGRNGNDDGRFEIAVKVTGPTNGLWHYEYIVHNNDNHRGGASFRLPVCAGARVENIGFRDIDTNALNNWTAAYAGGELAFTAPANNPHNWNTLYNFWFDSDVAPVAGNASIDQARVGPGALTVTVPTTVPGLQPSVNLGAGCGTPSADLFVNGVPSAGNAAFAIQVQSAPLTPVLMYFSDLGGNNVLAPGCTLRLDLGTMSTLGLYVTDAAGRASVAAPVSLTQTSLDLFFQGATLVPAAPLFGLVGLTSGLKVRFASTGCN